MAQRAPNRQQRLKRLRERVYLEHFLAQLDRPVPKIIEGQDDGQEPDFTVWVDGQWIGIELTTLPELRTQLGERSLKLTLQRYRWQLQRVTGIQLGVRLCRPRHLEFTTMPITQAALDRVMRKKGPLVINYHRRRALDELWLLIHMDYRQPYERVMQLNELLCYQANFDRVWLTRYPDSWRVEIPRCTPMSTDTPVDRPAVDEP